jgi:hypothetical protein
MNCKHQIVAFLLPSKLQFSKAEKSDLIADACIMTSPQWRLMTKQIKSASSAIMQKTIGW